MSNGNRPLRVVLIEDNAGDARLIHELLRMASFPADIERFETLKQGLERLARGDADLCLLDLTLPDSTGLDTFLAAYGRAPQVPIVVLTGLADEDLAVRAVHGGAQDYLVKGQVDGDLLARALRYAVERKRAELEVERARDAALRSARLKSAFLANMSHEIRTPLNIILGYVNVIADGGGDVTPQSRAAVSDGIQRAASRLMMTIDGILDISKMETGNFDVRPIRLDLRTVLERQVEDSRVLAREKKLSLELVMDVPNATIRFDEYCLARALMNLIQNAIKFTPQGGVTVRLWRNSDALLCVDVRDTGVGIDASYLPHLFQPFSQEEIGYTRRFEGTGLGLALTREYLERNGAHVVVESEKGRGSVFRIVFAAECDLSLPEVAIGEPVADDASSTDTARRPTVLVVEDDSDTQRYMAALLGRAYRLLFAASASEARERLEADPRIALVLMDLSLHGDEDGLKLTTDLRHHPVWRTLPIVAVTAHAFPEDRLRALEAGCNAYLAKPIRRGELVSVMEELLVPLQ